MDKQTQEHMPAPFLVKNGSDYVECDTPQEAQAKAKEIAQQNIGAYVDVYQCIGCMRAAASPLILPGSESNDG